MAKKIEKSVAAKQVLAFLIGTKKEFLHEIDSRCASQEVNGARRILRDVETMKRQLGEVKFTARCAENEMLRNGIRGAKYIINKARCEAVKKEASRIKASFPLALQRTKDASLNEDAIMEAALLRIMYPNGYFVNKTCVVCHKDNERSLFANKLYHAVKLHVSDLLLKGEDNGRIFLSDLKAIMKLEKAPELKTVKQACSDIHNATIESVAATQFRSGSCWLDLGFSSSLKKGLAVKWEVLNYE